MEARSQLAHVWPLTGKVPARRYGLMAALTALVLVAGFAGFRLAGRNGAAPVAPYPHEVARVTFAVAGDVIPHEAVKQAAAAAGEGEAGWAAC